MSVYKPRKYNVWRMVAMTLRGLSRLIRIWPLLLVAVVIISPVGPHLRVEYTYEQRGSHRQMIDCLYLGSAGFVRYVRDGECPVLTILDTRHLR